MEPGRGVATFSSACICTRRPAKIEIPAPHLCRWSPLHLVSEFSNASRRDATRGLSPRNSLDDHSFPICLCGDPTAIRAIFRKYWLVGRLQGRYTPRPDFLSPCWQGFIKVSLCVFVRYFVIAWRTPT